MRPKILKQCKTCFKTVIVFFQHVALQTKSEGFASLTEGKFCFVTKKGVLEEYEIDTETRVAQQEWKFLN